MRRRIESKAPRRLRCRRPNTGHIWPLLHCLRPVTSTNCATFGRINARMPLAPFVTQMTHISAYRCEPRNMAGAVGRRLAGKYLPVDGRTSYGGAIKKSAGIGFLLSRPVWFSTAFLPYFLPSRPSYHSTVSLLICCDDQRSPFLRGRRFTRGSYRHNTRTNRAAYFQQ